MILIISGFIDLSVARCWRCPACWPCPPISPPSPSSWPSGAELVGIRLQPLQRPFSGHFKRARFIATLGMQEIARGLALRYAAGPISCSWASSWSSAGHGRSHPRPCHHSVGVTVIIWYLVNQTCWGRSLYAIGGTATRPSPAASTSSAASTPLTSSTASWRALRASSSCPATTPPPQRRCRL